MMAMSEKESFNRDGYVVVNDVFPPGKVSSLGDTVMAKFKELTSMIDNNKLEFGVGIKFGYQEIVQRHPLRYEMPYKMTDALFDFVLEDATIRGVVCAILECDDYIVANRSLVISLPGCENQAWHTDGPHMSATKDLPCHCLNVFVPLVDVDLSNGPTEFRPASQYYTRDLAKSMLMAKIKKTLRPIETPCVSKGSVLLFDYRVLHRGAANMSGAARPILVFTLAKPWYKDILNFPHRSVFDHPNSECTGCEDSSSQPVEPCGGMEGINLEEQL